MEKAKLFKVTQDRFFLLLGFCIFINLNILCGVRGFSIDGISKGMSYGKLALKRPSNECQRKSGIQVIGSHMVDESNPLEETFFEGNVEGSKYELPSSYAELGPPLPLAEAEKGNSEAIVYIGSEDHFDAVMETAGKDCHFSVGPDGTQRISHKLVVAMVYGSWCRACMHMKPKFAALCEEHPEILGLKIDGGEVSSLMKRLNVRGLPTFIVFKNGKRVDHFSAKNKDDLEELIMDCL